VIFFFEVANFLEFKTSCVTAALHSSINWSYYVWLWHMIFPMQVLTLRRLSTRMWHTVWDVDRQENLRPLWKMHLSNSEALVIIGHILIFSISFFHLTLFSTYSISSTLALVAFHVFQLQPFFLVSNYWTWKMAMILIDSLVC
jgi:hypothetical protein